MKKEITILVVDDDPEIRLATVRLLRNAGYPVAEAENGETALGRVRKTHPDLVLLDVVLPDTDGHEICRTIKTDKELKNTYVILLSGVKSGPDDQSEGLEMGADGYVVRPVANRELLARVQAMARIIRAEASLKQIEWMLSPKATTGDAGRREDHDQGYGDLTALNHDGVILNSIGREHLKRFSDDYLELLGTFSAIYEANGDYAFGIFSSGWCRMMDGASRRLCDTPDNAAALNCGRWLCHESCWTDCSQRAIAEQAPVDIACHGGLRIYAVPIFAGKNVVGAINFGYGDPPKEAATLRKLADAYHINYDDLVREADAYDSRPPFIIGLAKYRLHATARLIGSMIETKQAEQALRESERRFRGMLGVVPDMISIHSPEMEILYSNWQGFAAVPEDNRIPNTKCYKTYRDFDDICPDCRAKTVLETQKPMQEETQLPDGTWVDLRVIPLLDKDNHVEMFMEWVRDITERKQAEEVLRESEETLRTTLNSIGDAVISTDRDGLVAAMNPVAESLTGWPEKAAAGQPLETVFRIINEKSRQPVESPVTDVLKSGHIVGLANHTLLIARDGREIPIADSGAPIRNDAGEIIGVVLVFRDQTEERAARKALQENADILDVTGRMARIGGWELYPETMKVTWTDETYRIHEVPTSVKPPLEDAINFWHPEDQPVLRKAIEQALENGTPYDLELRFITAKGRHLYARTKCTPVVRNGKVVKLQGFFQDITQRKRYEERIEHLLNVLRAIRDVNQLIVHENDRDALLRRSCEILISTRGYRSAWAALRGEDGKAQTVAESGIGDDFAGMRKAMQQGQWPECCRRAWEDPNGVTPIHNPKDNCKQCALSHTYRNTAALAGVLRCGDRDYGVLVVALPAGLADDPEEQSLFRELVGDVAYALYAMESEKRRREEEAKFRSYVENAPYGIFIADREGRYLDVNPRACDISGYARDELLSMSIPDLLAPDHREAGTQHFQALVESGYSDGEFGFVRKGGEIRQWRVLAEALSPDRFLGFVEDITDRKQAEETLQRSETSLKEAQQLAEIGNWSWNLRTGELSMSDQMYVIIGLPKSPEALDVAAHEKYYTPASWQRFRSAVETARETGTSYEIGLEVVRDNGGNRHVVARGEALKDDNGQVVAVRGTLQDITEQRNLEAQLNQSQKMESVGRLAGGVAHDYNNMLNVIMGYAEMALEKTASDGSLQEDLQEILDAARRSTDITRQLLAFARQQTIAPQVIDLNETVEGMLKMLRRLIGEDIDLSWQPGPGQMPVFMDPSQLDQMMANLCVNARDAIAGVGKLTIETDHISFDADYCAEHAGFVPGDFVLLAVSDDGCGMDKDTLDNIFEPFFTTKGVGEGTGLGLSTVFGIVKQNEGFINVYSEPDKGTTFRIYLPLHTGEAETITMDDTTEIPCGNGETLLVVEDEAAVLRLAQKTLAGLGYTVLTAPSPAAAMALTKQRTGPVDLLMTDVVMPGMNGRDLSKKLVEYFPNLRVLFMSGYTANVIAHRGMLDAGVHFIQKPFSSRDLAKKVREALES